MSCGNVKRAQFVFLFFKILVKIYFLLFPAADISLSETGDTNSCWPNFLLDTNSVFMSRQENAETLSEANSNSKTNICDIK